jgi:hypothetical protein
MTRVDLQAQTAQPLTRSAVYLGPYGVSVTATATCRYTALLSVAKSSGPRLEGLLMLQPSRISLHEWRLLSESARASAQESLLPVAHSRASQTEGILGQESLRSLRLESLKTLTPNISGQLEGLSPAMTETIALTEQRLGLQSARDGKQEVLGEAVALAERTAQQEWLIPLAYLTVSQHEALPTLAQEIASQSESLLGREYAAPGRLEHLLPISPQITAVWNSLLSLTQSALIRSELLQVIQQTHETRQELLGGIQGECQVNAESLSRLTKSSPGAWESLATLTRELTGLHEQLLGLAPSVKIWQDILRYIAVDKTAHSEWLIPVLQELGETYENLFPTVIATASALTEHRQGVDQSALLRLELLKRLVGVGVAATRTAVYEILRPVKQKRSGQFEKRGHVRARRSVWQELWGIIETLKASDAERAHAQAKERTSQAKKAQAQADQARQSQIAHQQRPDTQADVERKSREARGEKL